jgi:hypothetical protein
LLPITLSSSSFAVEETLKALPLKYQIMLIYSIKALYEHLVRTGNTDELHTLATALAGTAADGITVGQETPLGQENMLTLMQAMLANVRKAVQSSQALHAELGHYF